MYVKHSVRFISVNDNYDSADNNGSIGGLEVAMRTLVYDLYSKDLSVKVKSGMRNKVLQGKCVGFIPFGYKNSPEKKLVIDEESAKIVRLIFDLALEGKSFNEIARYLNENKVPSQNEYQKQNNKKKSRDYVGKYGFWTTVGVSRILRDERYTGKTISNKFERIEIGKNKQRALPKDEWLVIPDTHEPIVTQEQFDKVDLLTKRNTNRNTRPKKRRVLFAKVRCHHCNRALERGTQKDPVYKCVTPRYTVSPDCIIDGIRESLIENTLLTVIQKQIEHINCELLIVI